jgi:hypothetical protein
MGTGKYFATHMRETALTRLGNNQMILEKGIPVPPSRRGKWDFLDEMEIGDSLAVTTHREFESLRRSMYGKGMKYRSMKEPGGTGWRVWRIE